MRWRKWEKDMHSEPAPLEMTDTEVVDWMADNAIWVIWSHGKFHVTPDGGNTVSRPTLRGAICQAAAYMEEV